MKLKRHLPLIVMVLFSCVILIGVPGYFLVNSFTSKYPEDISTKISLSLRQGLTIAAIAIILIWIGAGLDSLLARIKDAGRRRKTSLIVYIGSFLLFIGFPAVIILSIYLLFSAQGGWQKLPSMPETPKAIVSAGKVAVTVETDSGNYYYCGVTQLSECWASTDQPSSEFIQNYEGELRGTTNPPQVDPPGEVVDIQAAAYNNAATQLESHYAVLSDGTVWYLNREVNNGTAGFATGLLTILILPIMIGVVVIFLGAGISYASRSAAARIWREAE